MEINTITIIMMHLFHGSAESDLIPIYGKGKNHNDFGKGFYCTENPEAALEWACRSNKTGYAYEYYLDSQDLRIFDIVKEKCSTITWLALLLNNRKLSVHNKNIQSRIGELVERFSPNVEEMDIIRGPRADDSYFMFAKDFISGNIPYRFLREAMTFSSLGTQIALISERSFKHLRMTNIHTGKPEIYYTRYIMTDTMLRSRYDDLRNTEWKRSEEITIENILDEGWEKDDPRLF